MKPIELILKNIGPYKEETIDFTKLENIFLITGNTGAGKTFIFDAMTYAIYGVLRGNRANHEKDLKSRYAGSEETEFYVEFTFQVGDDLYKVHRTVEFTKPGNKNATASTVMFFRKFAGAQEFEDLSGVNKKNKSDINGLIQNVVGLTAAEFSQIVLLPQGAFAEFLKQGTTERQKTLEKLFPVQDYQRIIETTEEKLKTYDKAENEIDAIIQSEKRSLKEAGLDLESTEEKIQHLKREVQNLEKKEKTLSEKTEKNAVSLTNLQHDYEGALDLEKKKQKKKELDERKEEIENLEVKIDQAEKANVLREYITAAENSKAHVLKAESELKNAEKVFNESRKNKDLLDGQAESMQKLKEKNSADKTVLDALTNKLNKQQEYNETVESEKKKETEKKNFESQVNESKEKIKQLSFELKDRKIEDCIKEITDAVLELQNKNNIFLNTKKLAEDRDLLISQLEDIKKKKQEKKEETEELEVLLQKTINSLELKKKALDEYKIQNAVFSLATLLQPGEACPVCGSKEHPCLAVKAEELLSPEEEVKSFEELVKDRTEKVNEKKLELEALLTQESEKVKSLKKYAEIEDTDSVVRKLDQITEDLKNALDKQTHLNTLQQQLSESNDLLQEREEQLHKAEILYQQYKVRRESLEKELGERIDTLQNQYNLLFNEYSENLKAFEKWEKEAGAAARDFSSAESTRKVKSENLENAEKEKNEKTRVLKEELKKSSFKTEAEAKLWMMELNDLTESRTIVQKYRNELSTVTEAIKDAKELKNSKEIESEISELNAIIEKDKKEYEQNHKLLEGKKQENLTLTNSYNKIMQQLQEKEGIVKEALPCRKLYEHISGKNAANVPFDTWALGMYFNQVVEFASQRFFNISDNRFEFVIKDIGNKGGRGFKGLDLQVIDHNTPEQQISDTADLSGGETFEASISLALAITDVVQNNNGGVTLDSLFIDEGFGTLDSEPLESTMRVLSELSETKMIGLISHVDSLKDSDSGINSQIIVHKTNNGSTVSIK